jgi:hypothetical protein
VGQAMNHLETRKQDDLLTVVSISIVVFAMANILHEAVGHGGTCLLVGGKALVLSSMHFEGDAGDMLGWPNRLMAAGGTMVNLLAAGIGYVALARGTGRSSSWRYFWWLFWVVNLLQATGYFLFSGLLDVGDWSEVIHGWAYPGIWRAVMTLVGGGAYFGAVVLAFRKLAKWIEGDEEATIHRVSKLALVSYLTGGILYVIAGLLNPIGIAIVFLSAVAASFGGASGLVWGPQLLRGKRRETPVSSPISIDRSLVWIIAAIVVSLVFILLLGPGIHVG